MNFLISKCTQRTAVVYLLISAFLLSLGGVFIKSIHLHPFALAGFRSSIAAIFVWLMIEKPKFNWSKAQILGGLAYAGMMLFFVTANKWTTAANAILLQYTAPIYVALFSFMFLKEKITRLDWITVFFVFSGMALFFIDDLQPQNVVGNLLAIASGMSLAAMVLFLRKQKDESPFESLLIGNIFTAIAGLPFMLRSTLVIKDFSGILFLGIVQLGLSYLLYVAAIKQVSAMEAVLITVIEPIMNPLWVLLLIGEKPDKWAFIGGTVVLLAVTIRCVLMTMNIQKNKSNTTP
ncbi:DMT family transporter [Clostridium formicaceticum]|nr:DMT family transporter [Clostridium formicaceticum]